MKQQQSLYQTAEDKLRRRLSMSYTERFRMIMQMIRVSKKMQQIKPFSSKV